MAYYSRKLKMPFQDVLNKVIQNLEVQGFGIVTTIDVKETFKEKLNLPFRNYKILGAYNTRFAYRAISIESHAGVMLLSNVIVQEHENGEVEISAINPLENLAGPFNTTHLVDLAIEVGIRLRAALDYLYRDLPELHDELVPADEFQMSQLIQG
jgi:uncharacterized protein (DUF302 family)